MTKLARSFIYSMGNMLNVGPRRMPNEQPQRTIIVCAGDISKYFSKVATHMNVALAKWENGQEKK